MTAKQPSAGEWWECRGTRVRIVGRMSSGDVVCELCDRSISVMGPIDLIGEIWQCLPDCDSWTWQPEVMCSMCGLSSVVKGTAGCKDCTEFALDQVKAPPSSPKYVPVRLLCSTENVGSVIWRMHDDPGYAGETEIKHDGYRFYVEVQP